MFLALVVALICAALSYVIADRNNMSKPIWTIVGFILGIFGLIITFAVAFFRNKDTSTV